MKADMIITGIKTLYNPNQVPPVKGFNMSKIENIDNPFIAIKDGKILDYGTHDYHGYIDSKTTLLDAKGKICLPGLIDSHTHLVHAGSREHEFSQLRQGIPYLDILKQGGGILGTVEKTKAASFNELYLKAYQSLNTFLSYGITTLEAKSGYGLSLDTEVKQLMVAEKLKQNHPIHVVSTYMGAHAVPLKFKHNRSSYINQIKQDMEIIKEKKLASFVDVFCETGIFDLKETKEILEKAKALGFKIKVHADEIDSLGGAGLGVDLNASSVDHLMAIKDEDIKKTCTSKYNRKHFTGYFFLLE